MKWDEATAVTAQEGRDSRDSKLSQKLKTAVASLGASQSEGQDKARW